MGGRLWLESVPGQGTTFHLSVKLPRGSECPADEDTKPAHQSLPEKSNGVHRNGISSTTPLENDKSLAAPLCVLLVEDNLVNRRLATALLQKLNYAVLTAENGQAALGALSTTSAIDAVLMDVQMPVMDGLEATAAIRRQEATTGQHVPIIALTAHAMKGDRELCIEAGMDDYLSKPVRVAELKEKLEAILQSRTSSCV